MGMFFFVEDSGPLAQPGGYWFPASGPYNREKSRQAGQTAPRETAWFSLSQIQERGIMRAI